jgi:hypothetical protein
MVLLNLHLPNRSAINDLLLTYDFICFKRVMAKQKKLAKSKTPCSKIFDWRYFILELAEHIGKLLVGLIYPATFMIGGQL